MPLVAATSCGRVSVIALSSSRRAPSPWAMPGPLVHTGEGPGTHRTGLKNFPALLTGLDLDGPSGITEAGARG